MTKAQLRELLEPLLKLPTAPFHEDAVAEYIAEILREAGLTLLVDPYGNLIVRRPSTGRSTTRLGFMAHMDHPGFEVISATQQGVQAAWYGGVHPNYFQNFPGVVFYAGGESFHGAITAVELNEQTNRVNAATVECDARPPVGALGMWDVPEVEFANGLVRARAIDDIAGCGLLLAMLLELGDRPLEAEVWVLFTRAEEVGFIGAIGLARSGRLPASLPVVSVEMSKAMPGATQGMGPVIRLGDRSSVFDHTFLLFIKDVAAHLKTEQEGFKYQQMLMDGGSCEATVLNAFGFRTAGLAVPLNNYHNQKPAGPNGPWALDAEEINFSDFVNAVDLAVAMCENFHGLEIVKTHHRLTLLERTGERLNRLELLQRQRERV